MLRQAVTPMGQLGRPKSKASKAAVPCVGKLADELKKWREKSLYPGPNDWIFPSYARAGKIPRSSGILVKDYLQEAARAAGIHLEPGKPFGLHSLRHGLCTWLISHGEDVRTVQALLRHSSPAITLQHYAHAVPQKMRDASQAASDAFFGVVN